MNLRPYLQFNRNLSARITAVLAKTPLTPNGVTTLGLLSGMAAGWVMSAGTHGALIAGAALLHLAFLLDNCDGELARLRGRSTTFGRWYDMTADVTVDFALWIGLGVGATARHEVGHWVIVGALAGTGSLINFAMVVYERLHGHSASVHIRKQTTPEIQNNTFLSILETLCHNGDVIAGVWILAFVGDPGLFLILGSIYIHGIWIARCSRYFPRFARALANTAGVAVGLYVLYLSTKGVSWGELARIVRSAGPAICLSFLMFPVVSFFHAAAFYCLLRKETDRTIPFWRVYRISLFGDAVNKITPFIDIGGEPFKIKGLAKKGIAETPEALRAAWMTRVLFVASEAVYLIPPVLLLSFYFPSREFTLIGVLGIVFSAVFAAVLFFLKDRVVGKGAGGPNHSATILAFLWHFTGWMVMAVEVSVILWALHIPADWQRVFLAQAFLQAITSVSFFIPGNVGAQEGGLALLMKHMGFSAETGIALSLFKRARQIVWALAGGVYFALSRSERS